MKRDRPSFSMGEPHKQAEKELASREIGRREEDTPAEGGDLGPSSTEQGAPWAEIQ